MSQITRRNFLQSSAVGAGLILTGTAASGTVLGANDRLRIGVVGLNGRGRAHINGWLGQENVEIAYLVDPDQRILARGMSSLQEKIDGKYHVKGVQDLREALEDP